jgi:rare lipoprotein A (peptidoglycan hydrolase)
MKRLVSLFVQALNGYLLVASLLVSCTHIQLPHALHPEAELLSPTTLGETVPETAKLPPAEETFETLEIRSQLDSSHVQYGVASWYGRPFHGRRTANGEVYNMHEVTAAHRTATLGTYAVVTNLNNGQSVQVRINDRGPMKRYRILDLSYRAAQEIGMVSTGTTRVKVEFLASRRKTPSDTSQTAHLVSSPASTLRTLPSSPEPVRSTPVSFPMMQAGMVHGAQDVTQARPTLAVRRLERQMPTFSDSAPPWYRGRLGPSFNREDAEQIAPQTQLRATRQPL